MNKRNILKGLIVANLILITFYLVTINHRYINIDEAVIGEQAYWLQKVGVVKSNLLSGLDLKWEDRVYHYHKLFVVLGAVITKLFGFSLINFRLITLFFSLLFYWTMWKLIVVHKEFVDKKITFLIISFLFLVNTLFFSFSYLYRPEVMVMTLGFISYYFLRKHIKSNNTREVIYSGIFAGLAALTHLNGLIFIVAGFILLLIYKYYIQSVVFGVIGTFVLCFYFFDLLSPESFQGFLFQFTNDPNLEKADFSLLTPFLKIFSEHLRFFHGLKESIFSLLFVSTLIFNFKYLINEHKSLLIYSLLTIILLAGIAHGSTTKYALLYFPYIFIIIGIGINRVGTLSRFPKWIVTLLLITYSGYHMYSTISNNVNLDIDYNKRNALINKLTNNTTAPIITDESYVFNELENGKTIHSLLLLSYLKEYELGITEDQLVFDDYALRNDNKFVLIDKLTESDQFLSNIGFDKLQQGDTVYQYVVKDKVDDMIVFELIK
ncbi:MAG: glycosyltransferase family 39 protein [Cyclobacteriaceae bacterium]|nr:glycosyltransferase family 39 protein [Cyclobacteriaceae bacterium]